MAIESKIVGRNGTPYEVLTVSRIVESICIWNAVRYEQSYNHHLTYKLLEEELYETEQAVGQQDKVEVCDGLADIFFVAIGAMWKFGYTQKGILTSLDEVPMHLPPPVALFWLGTTEVDDIIPEILANMAVSTFQILENLSSTKKAEEIIWAVCKSNHTKRVEKVSSAVKANVTKGENYIPPTEEIKHILEKE